MEVLVTHGIVNGGVQNKPIKAVANLNFNIPLSDTLDLNFNLIGNMNI